MQPQETKSVLLYSDCAEFGGHEAMTLEAIRCLSRDRKLSIWVLFYKGNFRLQRELTLLADAGRKLTLVPLELKTKSLQAFRSLLCPVKIRYLRSLIRRIHPDVVLVSQGRIEGSSMGLLAAKGTGIRTVSYIPMAHEVSVCGTPFALFLREKVNRYFYRLPDEFITISESSREMLRRRGVTQNVMVVPNGIKCHPIAASERWAFRREHNLDPSEWALAVIGRIDFRQKGQDFAVEMIRRFRHRLTGYRFFFVGDGPDRQRLTAMIESGGLAEVAHVLPWRQDLRSVYAGIDMLLLPSKFEGVPLVMLEAMSHKLPIVASDSDGMAELLPENWLFRFGDHSALFHRILQVKQADNLRLLERHQKLIAENFTMEKFGERFTAALLQHDASLRYLRTGEHS